jgi:hypothetical protein
MRSGLQRFAAVPLPFRVEIPFPHFGVFFQDIGALHFLSVRPERTPSVP